MGRKPTRTRTKPRRPARRGFLVRAVRWLPIAVIAIGFLLIAYSELNHYYSQRALRPSVAAVATVHPNHALPVRLIVPGLLNQPLEAQLYSNGQWTVSDTAGSYLTQSAKPGEAGNIIVYGHNKQQIFGPLLHIKKTDPVVLMVAGGGQRRYRITELETLDTSRTDVLAATKTETLTIYTCTGWLDSKRFVVRAVPE